MDRANNSYLIFSLFCLKNNGCEKTKLSFVKNVLKSWKVWMK
jgi:hypothetical protein